jgi:hypothetical protein
MLFYCPDKSVANSFFSLCGVKPRRRLVGNWSVYIALEKWPARSGRKDFLPRRGLGRPLLPLRLKANPGSLKITPISCLATPESTPNPRPSFGQECRLRLKRPPANASRRCSPFKSLRRSSLGSYLCCAHIFKVLRLPSV